MAASMLRLPRWSARHDRVHMDTRHSPDGSDSRDGALGPYLRAVRNRRLLVAAITILTVLAAGFVLHRRVASYEATTHLLVTPLPQDDRVFLGIELLRDSGDPTRTVQTAATVIASPEAARQTATIVGAGLDGAAVAQAVSVLPLGESNVVAVTARDASPRLAAAIANTYSEQSLVLRGKAIHDQIHAAIAAFKGTRLTADERGRLLELRAVADRGDPTLRITQRAELPTSPTGRSASLVLTLALVAGLVLGAMAAVLMERVDRRVRELPQLLELWPLPVLARVPPIRRAHRGARAPPDAPPGVREAFRTLQLQLDQQTIAGRVVMVTSASSGDGKTTSTVNLARALVGAGHRVIAMDFDVRKPDLERQLGIEDSSGGLVALLSSTRPLAEVLRPAPGLAPLRVFSAAGSAGQEGLLQALSLRMREIVEQAGELADYVIIDTAPLGEVGDALPIAALADDVLLIGRPGHTDASGLATARELLTRAGIEPRGWIVIGDRDAARATYYYATDGGRPPRGPRPGTRSVIG
jgi:Mrp family chromosome partitioning ATPase/capsular polysaccharide biosynthesis protein